MPDEHRIPPSHPTESELALVEELRRTLGRLDSALAQIREALVLVDADGEVIWTNASFDGLVGKRRIEILGTSLHSLLPLNHVGEQLLTIEQTRGENQKNGLLRDILSELPLRVWEVEWHPVLTEEPNPLVFSFRDVSDQMALATQALKCPVTNLLNRRGLMERIHTSLLNLCRHPGTVTLLFFDLNHFKEVNDFYGHHVGDLLLIEIAQRLRAQVRPGDEVGRIGGDEFVVLATDVPSELKASQLAERLHAGLTIPWHIEGKIITPQLSIGIALTDDPEMSVHELLHRADLAMYSAKSTLDCSIKLFNQQIEAQANRETLIRRRLKSVLDAEQLCVAFQPIVSLESRSRIGFEALVQLPREEGVEGALLANEFTPVAERAGLIQLIGDKVLGLSLEVLMKPGAVLQSCWISINVSPMQISQEDMAYRVIQMAAKHRVELSRVMFEVTESKLIDQPQRVMRQLKSLRDSGCRVYLDDFGIGYSSMSRLAKLPIDGIKIDSSFIAGMLTDIRSSIVVSSMIRLARDLGLDVIAEGVEEEAQVAALLGMGCDKGQGCLFGLPISLP